MDNDLRDHWDEHLTAAAFSRGLFKELCMPPQDVPLVRQERHRPHKRHVVVLTAADRAHLLDLLRKPSTARRSQPRIHVLLLADQGADGPALTDREIALKTNISVRTIEKIRAVFASQGLTESVRWRRPKSTP